MLVLAFGAPLSVIALVAGGWSQNWLILLGALPVWVAGLVIVWVRQSRYRNELSRRIADDLWMRGFAVQGLTPVFESTTFLAWLRENRATSAQIESAALAPIVRDAPQRTAGRSPLAMKFAIGAGLTSGLTLFGLFLVNVSATATEAAGVESIRDMVLVSIGASFAVVAALCEGLNIYLAARGGRIARFIATWQLPLLVVLGVLFALQSPQFAIPIAVILATWAIFVGLLWTPSARRYIDATTKVRQVIAHAVANRIAIG